MNGQEKTHILNLVKEKKGHAFKAQLRDLPVPDVAELILDAPRPDAVLIYRALPREKSWEVFAHLDPEHQEDLLKAMTEQETRHVLAEMPPDDRTALLEELPAEVTRRLMNLLSPEDLAETRQLLGYPEESVGRLMTPDYVSVREDWTVRDALRHIRREGRDSETVNLVYVTDASGKLVDEIKLRKLIIADPDALVQSVMDYNFASLSAFDDREKAVAEMKKYDLVALPVVDSDGKLVGIVTVDDVLDVAEEEASEDMYKLAGLAVTEEEISRSTAILESPLPSILRLRLPWLLVALTGALVAGFVVGSFEESLNAIIALAFFIPVVMDMGGNVGTQASTIFVRGHALGHIHRANVAKHIGKEMLVGFTIGVIVGSLAGVIAYAWQGMIELSLVIFLSLTATCTIASTIGYLIPWLAHKLGQDPAAVSNPLLTTVKDVTGLLIYFGLATFLLTELL